MNTTELYQKLIESYSNSNLNAITGKLILLYKNKNFAKIRELAHRISKFVPIEEEKDSKCFSRLMMLYHPDRGEHHRNTISNYFTNSNRAGLNEFQHIFELTDIETVSILPSDNEIEYNPEYIWDVEQYDGYSYSDNQDEYQEDIERTFYNAIKIREYGHTNIEFPSYYLEDIEEFEVSYNGIEDLDGVEHCIHAKIMDLSNNQFSDISKLANLQNIEELYLNNNQIGYIDVLSNLMKLKTLDLSYNQIDDISPLLELENLEYVNLLGNPIKRSDIGELRKRNILVMA